MPVNLTQVAIHRAGLLSILSLGKGVRTVPDTFFYDLGNKVLTSTCRTTLPQEKVLIAEIERTRRMLELRSANEGQKPK
jgi:hypothetical protein